MIGWDARLGEAWRLSECRLNLPPRPLPACWEAWRAKPSTSSHFHSGSGERHLMSDRSAEALVGDREGDGHDLILVLKLIEVAEEVLERGGIRRGGRGNPGRPAALTRERRRIERHVYLGGAAIRHAVVGCDAQRPKGHLFRLHTG